MKTFPFCCLTFLLQVCYSKGTICWSILENSLHSVQLVRTSSHLWSPRTMAGGPAETLPSNHWNSIPPKYHSPSIRSAPSASWTFCYSRLLASLLQGCQHRLIHPRESLHVEQLRTCSTTSSWSVGRPERIGRTTLAAERNPSRTLRQEPWGFCLWLGTRTQNRLDQNKNSS